MERLISSMEESWSPPPARDAEGGRSTTRGTLVHELKQKLHLVTP